MIEIQSCPRQFISAEVWEAIEAAEMLEHGLAPVTGGALDQTVAFLDSVRFIRGLDQKWRALLNAPARE
jgi:hypothetical protein